MDKVKLDGSAPDCSISFNSLGMRPRHHLSPASKYYNSHKQQVLASQVLITQAKATSTNGAIKQGVVPERKHHRIAEAFCPAPKSL